MVIKKRQHEFLIVNFVLSRKLFEDAIWLSVIEGKPICFAQLLLDVEMDLLYVRESR